MRIFEGVFSNHYLNVAAFSWLSAQLMKFILTLLINKKLDFTRITGSGGMPSAHTAFFCSLTTLILLLEGGRSSTFALAFCTTAVVMYDATGVRRAAGEQAKILNKMVNAWVNDKGENPNDFGKNLKELLGHSKTEVVAGLIYGVMIALLYYFLFLD